MNPRKPPAGTRTGLAARFLDCFRGIPSAVANLREFVENSHRYTDSTGARFAAEAAGEFFLSLWNYREYSNNLELAASVSWEEVNEKLPVEYNFRTRKFEYDSDAVELQSRVRYELAGAQHGSVKFPTPTRRQLDIDRDRRDATRLINNYIERTESVLHKTRKVWNQLFSVRTNRLQTEKALQRLEQYRKVEHELNSIVLKHYDTTEDSFIASNKVNREVYAKLNATPGYTISSERTRQSYRKRVGEISASVAAQVETYRAFDLEVDSIITLRTSNNSYRGRPLTIRGLSRELRKSVAIAVTTFLSENYGQLTAGTVLNRDTRLYSNKLLVQAINTLVKSGRPEPEEPTVPGVRSLTGL